MPLHVIAVDLGHHEGHVGIQAEGVRVVHDGGPALHGLGQELLGDGVIRCSKHDVHALEGLGASLLNLDLAAVPGNHLACRARARQQAKLAHREVALLEALQHLGSHGASGTQDRDVLRI